MKNTWLYKKLEHLHQENSFFEGVIKSGFLENIANIFIVPASGFCLIVVGLLSSLLLPLFLIKDLYDLYCHLNAEKIAKKEAIKKALEHKNKIKNWIDSYQKILQTPYILQKITVEKKPKVEELPGVNTGYKGNVIDNSLFLTKYLHYIENNNQYNKYKYTNNCIIKKEILTKEFVNSNHSKFEYFIIAFFKKYNNEYNTVHFNNIEYDICDTHRRRSLHDIYLITKYYYPEITFIDIIKTIISLLKMNIICGSYCSTVKKYVFYTPSVSEHNNFNSFLEFTKDITFNDLKKYIEDEQ